MPKIVLVFTAHPDDAEYFAGGTIAKMIKQGAQVTYVITTDGRRGSFQHQTGILAPIREEEATRAAYVMGAEPPILLSHPDHELDRLPSGKLREQFCRLIRQHKPDAIIAQDPFSLTESHPDHRIVAWAISDAVHYAYLPLIHPEHLAMGLEPHFVNEKYFFTESSTASNLIIDISDTIEQKITALLEHKSQISFLVEGAIRQTRSSGIDLEKMLGDTGNSPESLFAWFIKNTSAEVGKRKGYKYGEAFRFERYSPLVERFLASQAPKK